MKNRIRNRTIAASAVAAVALTGIGLASASAQNSAAGYGSCPLPQGSDPIDMSQYDFQTEVTNPLWPMAPRTEWHSRESDTEGGHQHIDVKVLRRTRLVDGVEATVVHDVAREGGKIVENTFDWYTQDKCGNVWYFGENTRSYENGHVSREGSWESGVDGALPGVIVPAEPVVGMTYRQEYLAGEAEDNARVLGLDEKAMTPSGYYRHTLLTAESTPLEPRVSEYKFLAPGVGPVLALGISGESDREELMRVTMP